MYVSNFAAHNLDTHTSQGIIQQFAGFNRGGDPFFTALC